MPLVRRRRPILRAVGAAAVGGAAYHAGERAGAEATPPTEPAYSSPPAVSMEHLQELGRLHDQGVLTDAEFEQQKQRYLNPR
jgi:Short C-terminal domain